MPLKLPLPFPPILFPEGAGDEPNRARLVASICPSASCHFCPGLERSPAAVRKTKTSPNICSDQFADHIARNEEIDDRVPNVHQYQDQVGDDRKAVQGTKLWPYPTEPNVLPGRNRGSVPRVGRAHLKFSMKRTPCEAISVDVILVITLRGNGVIF